MRGADSKAMRRFAASAQERNDDADAGGGTFKLNVSSPVSSLVQRRHIRGQMAFLPALDACTYTRRLYIKYAERVASSAAALHSFAILVYDAPPNQLSLIEQSHRCCPFAEIPHERSQIGQAN